MKQKTYRVPKKVSDNARNALTLLDHIDLKQSEGVTIAQALTSGVPVGPNVLRAIDAYFASRAHARTDVPTALMYGGQIGRDWANRCITMSVAPTRARTSRTKETVEQIFDISQEEFDALHAFTETMKAAVEKSEEKGPTPEDVALAAKNAVVVVSKESKPVDAPERTDEGEAAEELEEQIETALGLATQLDETVEKLAEALDDALVETDGEEPIEEIEPEDPEVEAMERRMVMDALAEIGIDDIDDPDYTAEAALARERMAAAKLVRERSLAMAKMASARMGLKTQLSAKEEPPEPAPVSERTARARLDHPLPPVENISDRLDAYLQWAQYRTLTAALGREEEEAAPTEPQGTGEPADPYFVAEVDPIDPTAVLGLYAFIPAADPEGIQCFIRADGGWVADPEFLQDLQSTTPPTVVELDYDTLLSVIEQIDAYDLANPD